MQNAVFRAVLPPQKSANKEFQTLTLLTPQRENLGDILVKEMCSLLEVPIPTDPTPISISHYNESGHIFYQIPSHFPEVFKCVEDFDILVGRELTTIRALIPDYSNEKEVRKRLGNDKDKEGHLFAALYSQDGKWYRASVIDYVKGDDEVWILFLLILAYYNNDF
jgi:hypothetical protein